MSPSFIRLHHPWEVNRRKPDDPDEDLTFWHGALSRSKWFTRGWTLQELIAPKILRFFGSSWNCIGDREELAVTISEFTKIESDILCGLKDPASVNVARKMNWFGSRKTTRVEDQAYSLLGLFGVNMPMLYGEGPKAFLRLQEQILRKTNDQTILAWRGTTHVQEGRLLANSPGEFSDPRHIVQYRLSESFEVTNRGLRLQLPLVNVETDQQSEYLAILDCRFEDDLSKVLALPLREYASGNGYHLPVKSRGMQQDKLSHSASTDRLRYVTVTPKHNKNAKRKLVEITWTFEEEYEHSEEAGIRFWLRVPDTLRITDAVSDFYRSDWNLMVQGKYKFTCSYSDHSALSEKIAYSDPPRRFAIDCPFGMVAALECFSERSVFIAIAVDGPNLADTNGGLIPVRRLGVSLRFIESELDTRSLGWWLNNHLDRDLVGNRSPYMQFGTVSTRLQLTGNQAVDANIIQHRVLGEDVIICTITCPQSF